MGLIKRAKLDYEHQCQS